MDRKQRYLALFLVLYWSFYLVSCGPKFEYSYQIPVQNNDGWLTASLEDVGMHPEPLTELMKQIHTKAYKNVHGILIVKDSKLVFEEYFEGYTFSYTGPWSSIFKFRGDRIDFGINTPHNLASVTKSITSALVGIAIDQGYINNVDEQVFSYFPGYSHLNNKQKDKITLENLLTMTSGLKWNELELWLGDMNHDLIQLFLAPDPIEYILTKPVVAEPGTSWYYNGGGVNLLGEVIRAATGMRMDEFAEKHLLAPLGISQYQWDHLKPDVIHASGNMKLRPRDMAKFGFLYLNGGVWDNRQIISHEWVEASTKVSVAIPWESLAPILGKEYTYLPETHGDRYGYLWWLKTYHTDTKTVEAYLASGWGGQKIVVFPSLDMVVILTGGNYATHEPDLEIIWDSMDSV